MDRTVADRRIFGRLGLVALALAFVVGVAVINMVFRGVQVDLTENDLYTLSPGTARILDNIPEPVNLYLFFSDRATGDIPYLRTYAGRVREMLQEFADRSGGRLSLTVVDPMPFSEEEDRAAGFGLQAINLGQGGDPIYLGVAGTNSVGDDEVIAFLDPSREQFLEYELAKLVQTLAQPHKPVVGLLSSLPMTSGFDPLTQQVREPWAVAEQMRQLFELRLLQADDLDRIDADVKVLMVVHPQDLPEGALYAIDQFVLGGGRAVFFVDPHAEIDPGDPVDPSGLGGGASRASDLGRLFTAWGIQVSSGEFIGDDRYALTVSGPGMRPVRHLGIIGVDQTGLAADDVITSGLNILNLAFAGSITKTTEGAAEITPLVQSSDIAAPIPVDRLLMLPDPDMLREGFTPTGQRYTLAARITGKLPSAFAAGRAAPPGGEAEATPHLAAAADPVNIVLVADADLLADRLWVQAQNFFGQRVNTAFASNGDFVINVLDNLLGSGDLISIRSRATFTRPFRRVQDLRREAEARFRETEQRLQDELQETEARLSELQARRTDQGATILTPEQQSAIERFQDRRLELRRELRQVQRNLDRDIERLGTTLKVINIALIPVVVSLLSIALLLLRRRRRRAATVAAAKARTPA